MRGGGRCWIARAPLAAENADTTETQLAQRDGELCVVASRSDLLRIDLRSLQRSRVIDVDRLPFAEHVQSGDAGFTMTVTGCLGAAERKMDFRSDRRRVHVEDAGVHVPHG